MLECKRQSGSLVLAGELKVQYLESLGDCLSPELYNADALEVDLTQVRSVDMAGLQLLLAFCRTREPHGPLSLGSPSAAFIKAIDLSGLRTHFAPFLA